MEQTNTSPEFVFDIQHQETYSRGQLLLRSFFGFFYILIPHGFLLFFMSLAGGILSFISWWIVLITGQYPKSFFDFQVALIRWTLRISARFFNLSDGYPAFGLNATDERVTFELKHPEKLSRGTLILRTVFGIFYVLIPHGICLFGLTFATMSFAFVAWWSVLFTGKYPKYLHELSVGMFRWRTRVQIYMSFLTDTYPPFSGK